MGFSVVKIYGKNYEKNPQITNFVGYNLSIDCFLKIPTV